MVLPTLLRSPSIVQLGASAAIAATSTLSGLNVDRGLVAFGAASLASSGLTGPDFSVDTALTTLSWGVILQSSLVMSIWSLYHKSGSARSRSRSSLPNLSLAFIFGTIGSVLSAFVGNAISPGKWGMAITCLTGSFIGGSVNFFECASALGPSTEERKVLNMIAGADILVMIAYFAFMLASRQALASILPPRKEFSAASPGRSYSIGKQQYWKEGKSSNLTVIKTLLLSLGITSVASNVQSRFPKIPGLAVPISTLMAVVAARTPLLQKAEMVQPGKDSGLFMLCLFYAVIGLDCRVQNMVTLGLPALRVMTTMLATHFGITIGLSAIWNRTIARGGRAPVVDVDDAIIASNVCIGGASTASAMAFSMGAMHLVVPASILGVVGYLLGTPLGLGVYARL